MKVQTYIVAALVAGIVVTFGMSVRQAVIDTRETEKAHSAPMPVPAIAPQTQQQ